MKIIKRNGMEVQFDPSKIVNAITAANNEVLAKEISTKLDELLEKVEG